jgi:ribosomal protein S11
MAKAQQVTSTKAAAKKRVVKVDTYGDAHISASFNNIIISITIKTASSFHGAAPVKWVSKDPRRIRRMQLKWLLPTQPKQLWMQV